MDSVAAVVKSKIDMLLGEKDFVIVAIDGKCTSGKTTLASKLAELYDCNVFHMDDFFLRRPPQTVQVCAVPGGERSHPCEIRCNHRALPVWKPR